MEMPNWLRRRWYGRYHITLARQVTNEETVQITFSETSAESFNDRVGMVLRTLRDHMIKHNNTVVLEFKSRIDNLIEELNSKGKELSDIEQELSRRRGKLERIKG